MSVRDISKVLIIVDCLDGQVIDTIKINNYSIPTIESMIHDILQNYCFTCEHGFMVKVGYNN